MYGCRDRGDGSFHCLNERPVPLQRCLVERSLYPMINQTAKSVRPVRGTFTARKASRCQAPSPPAALPGSWTTLGDC
jgi:hypothetical protein